MKKPQNHLAFLLISLLLYQCLSNPKTEESSLTSSKKLYTVDDIFKSIYDGKSICDPGAKAYRFNGSIGIPQIQDIKGAFTKYDTIEKRNDDVVIDFLQHEADVFSWESFIAINWPSSEAAVPDTTKCFGQPGKAVWEGWMPSHRIFKKDGTAPDPWPFGSDHEVSRMSIFGKASSFFDSLDDLDSLSAEQSAVIDQNKNYVLFEIFYNKAAYDYVTEGKLYNREGQKEFVQNWPNVTSGLTVVKESAGIKDTINIQKEHKRLYFPVGNIKDSTRVIGKEIDIFTRGIGAAVIKTAWTVLLPEEDHSQYYTREVQGNGDKMTLGLVGMHLIHKIAESTQWVWGTFEHKANAPLLQDGELILDRDQYRFFDISNNDTSLFNCPPDPIFQPVQASRVPSQVVRIRDSIEPSKAVDDYFQKIIKESDPNSVWLNYRLVGTQWPFDPTLFTPGRQYQPQYLANAILETYHQKSSSCMTCHRDATILKKEHPPIGYSADFIFSVNLDH